MKHKFYALATVVALNFIPISVDAATVNLDNQGRVTDLFDLNVDGILYNVDFQFDTFQNLFGDVDDFQNEPTFWNQKDLGVAARNAINRELNALNPIPGLILDDNKDIDFSQFYIPFDSNNKFKNLGCIVSSRSGVIKHEVNQMLPRVKEQVFGESLNILEEALTSPALLANPLV